MDDHRASPPPAEVHVHTKGRIAHWAQCHAILAKRADGWRAALATNLREAIGCPFVSVHDYALNMSVSAPAFGPVMQAFQHRFLGRIRAAGEGMEHAQTHHGPVYAPVSVSRREDLREECRQFWADAGVRGYGVVMLGPRGEGCDTLIVIGDERGDEAMLEAIGPGLLGLAAHYQRLPKEVPAATTPLTRRESQIASLLADGLSNLNVAARLDLAEATVAVHTRNIYRKLGVHNRVDLMRRWLHDEVHG